MKLYVNSFELDIYTRKTVLPEKREGEWKRRNYIEVKQLLARRCLETDLAGA